MEKWHFSICSPCCVNREVWNFAFAREAVPRAWGFKNAAICSCLCYYLPSRTWLSRSSKLGVVCGPSQNSTVQNSTTSRLMRGGSNNCVTVVFWRGMFWTAGRAEPATWPVLCLLQGNTQTAGEIGVKHKHVNTVGHPTQPRWAWLSHRGQLWQDQTVIVWNGFKRKGLMFYFGGNCTYYYLLHLN